MGVLLKLCFLYIFGGTLCEERMSWLACSFLDEKVFKNAEGHLETEFFPRDAMLQFGKAAPVNPDAITFLVSVGASKLDLRSYMGEGSQDRLECEIRRYCTRGIQVRWPRQGAQVYDRWFTLTIKHPDHSWAITGFLRHTPAQPPSEAQDAHSVPPIGDREIITISASMVLHSRSVALKAGLRSKQQLHCQFAVDHRGPSYRVGWRARRQGDWAELYSHDSRSVTSQGSGKVAVKLLAATGDATLTIPFVKISSEGKYVCSVSVTPLNASLDVALRVFEPPKVSLNVGPDLVLKEGAEQKVECNAGGYYPLEMEIEWFEEPPMQPPGHQTRAQVPSKLQNVLHSSHRPNQEGTFSLSAFFYYKASSRDSGKRYTCRVTHGSLRTPVRKTFTLLVHEPLSWGSLALGSMVFILLIVILFFWLNAARRESRKSKPY